MHVNFGIAVASLLVLDSLAICNSNMPAWSCITTRSSLSKRNQNTVDDLQANTNYESDYNEQPAETAKPPSRNGDQQAWLRIPRKDLRGFGFDYKANFQVPGVVERPTGVKHSVQSPRDYQDEPRHRNWKELDVETNQRKDSKGSKQMPLLCEDCYETTELWGELFHIHAKSETKRKNLPAV